MARRGENIRKRTDGRWEGRYKVYRDNTGKTVYHSVYGKTYAEVKDKLKEQKKVDRDIKGRNITFGEAAEQWLLKIKTGRKHSTYVKYSCIYRRYLKIQLSGKRLNSINALTINTMILNTNMVSNMSESIQNGIYCVLNQIIIYASIHYQSNDIRLNRTLCKKKARPVEIMSRIDQSRLIRYLYDDMDISKLGILLCISTGLRLGEICALKWSDIDFEQNILHISSTVQRIGVENARTRTVLMETEPKSESSKRDIPIPKPIGELLYRFKGHEKYCLCRNKPMEPRTYQKRFQTYLKEAGVKKCNFHVIRHTFATNCIDYGMDVKSLSEIMGHSDVQITLRRYVHPTMATKRKYLDALSSIYGQYCGQSKKSI